jgi:uncharacterized protein (DUF433 family)
MIKSPGSTKENTMTKDANTYTERITQNPEVMAGKPVIKGTRIPVERVLAHLAQNPDLADLFAAYPELTEEDVKASFAYARAVIERNVGKADRGIRVPAAHV